MTIEMPAEPGDTPPEQRHPFYRRRKGEEIYPLPAFRTYRNGPNPFDQLPWADGKDSDQSRG